jgi:hypothetical protein
MPDISCTPKELGESQCRAIDGFAAIFSAMVYYNQVRTQHRAIQRSGAIVGVPILAGPHHQYVRI